MTEPAPAHELLVTYTLFPDTGAQTKTERADEPWSNLVAKIRDAPTFIDKAHCPLISFADYGDELTERGCIRHAGNVSRVYGIEIDYDGEKVTPREAEKRLRAADLRAVLYTSPSHRQDAPRWRALLPLSEPTVPGKRAEYVGRANRALGGITAAESFDLSRSYYIGRVRGAEYEVIETQGRTVDTASDLEPLYPSGRDANGKKPRDGTTDADLRACFVNGQGRYEAMLKLSARWASRGMAADDIDANLLELLGGNPFNDDGIDLRTRIRGMVDGAISKFQETRAPKPQGAPPEWELPPVEAYEEPAGKTSGRSTDSVIEDEPEEKPKGPLPMDWDALDGGKIPEREWAIDHWLPMGHVTLLAGAGGAGKTLLAQALGSCIALQREYLDYIPKARRVLMWACEDEHDELWRRQHAIASWLKEPLSAFTDKFVLFSYHGKLVQLAGIEQQKLTVQHSYLQLRAQIEEFKAEVVILDNVARLYGGNENDRHQVTSFIALLTSAAQITNAAILLLGHPSKAINSEYSGSTAWEGAVRARLYLGRKLPDEGGGESDLDDEPEDETLRFLCRRKANYSSRDYRRLRYDNGVMTAEGAADPGVISSVSPDYAADVVLRALRSLQALDIWPNGAQRSPDYLPKRAREYKLLDRLTYKQFIGAMHQAHKSGAIKVAHVCENSNRTPRNGFVIS